MQPENLGPEKLASLFHTASGESYGPALISNYALRRGVWMFAAANGWGIARKLKWKKYDAIRDDILSGIFSIY